MPVNAYNWHELQGTISTIRCVPAGLVIALLQFGSISRRNVHLALASSLILWGHAVLYSFEWYRNRQYPAFPADEHFAGFVIPAAILSAWIWTGLENFLWSRQLQAVPKQLTVQGAMQFSLREMFLMIAFALLCLGQIMNGIAGLSRPPISLPAGAVDVRVKIHQAITQVDFGVSEAEFQRWLAQDELFAEARGAGIQTKEINEALGTRDGLVKNGLRMRHDPPDWIPVATYAIREAIYDRDRQRAYYHSARRR